MCWARLSKPPRHGLCSDHGVALKDRTASRWRGAIAIVTGVVAAGIVVAVIIVLNIAIRQRDLAIDRQQASYEVMILARRLDASMGQAEAMLGRFVISGKDQKSFGRQYFDDWRRAGAELEVLDRAVSDPPTQRLIDRLRHVYAVRGQELADVALRSNYGQNAQAFSLYYQAGRSPTVARMAHLLDAIVANERTVLTARTQTADARIGRANSIGTALSLLGLLLAMGIGWLGWRMLEAQREREDEAERSAELEAAVAARTFELSREMVEREAAETRLRQAQKLEAIGQLTGGIAHDFNNMLAVVVGGIDLARRKLSASSAARTPLDQAMEGAERAAALTRRLLGFARAEPVNARPADANALLDDMGQLLERVIGDTIRVRIERADGLWPIRVDRHQFENAVLNLAVNARDAMPDGGTLVLSTANLSFKPGPGELPPGDYVRVAVLDTGHGMSPEIVARVFEPFFTTKGLAQGTGLGLSQIHGFVQAAGGTIEVESREGEGTLISLLFPRSDGIVIAIGPTDETAVGPVAARQVLVVEDDPRVLASTMAALGELGHRATACGSAADAVGIIAARPDLELVISDVMMPDLTGPQLQARVHAVRAALPFLFVTGFAEEEAVEALAGARVLRKPFTIAALGLAVEDALRASPSEPVRAPAGAAA